MENEPREEMGNEGTRLSDEERERLNQLVTLPDEGEMLERLKAINDSPHLVEEFYPLLLKNAGQKRTRQGVDTMVKLAIYDYTKNLPPKVTATINVHAEDFVEALTRES